MELVPPTETTLLTLNFLIEAGRPPFSVLGFMFLITIAPYPVDILVELSGLGSTFMGIYSIAEDEPVVLTILVREAGLSLIGVLSPDGFEEMATGMGATLNLPFELAVISGFASDDESDSMGRRLTPMGGFLPDDGFGVAPVVYGNEAILMV